MINVQAPTPAPAPTGPTAIVETIALALALALALVSVLASCNRSDPKGPPELRLGHDICAECGMIINEDRFCSALLIDDLGRSDHLLFDDLCCMFDLLNDPHRTPRVLAGFAKDYPSRQWIDARGASYVAAPAQALTTPMGSGFVAFRSRDEADAAAGQYGGEVTTFDGLAEIRRDRRANPLRRLPTNPAPAPPPADSPGTPTGP